MRTRMRRNGSGVGRTPLRSYRSFLSWELSGDSLASYGLDLGPEVVGGLACHHESSDGRHFGSARKPYILIVAARKYEYACSFRSPLRTEGPNSFTSCCFSPCL